MAKLLERAGVKGRKPRRETSSTTPGVRSRRHVVTARISAQDSRCPARTGDDDSVSNYCSGLANLLLAAVNHSNFHAFIKPLGFV